MRTSYVFMITRSAAPQYVWGAAVAAWCLRQHSQREIHFLVTEAVDADSRRFLAQLGTGLIETPLIHVPGIEIERFRDNYTKLGIFNLTDFDRVVYLDADVLPLHSLDHLFDLSSSLGAALDLCRGVDNYFNAGVLSLRPDRDLFQTMLESCQRDPRNRGYAEQDFLNWWFGPQPRWLRPAHLRNWLAARGYNRWQVIAYEDNATHLAAHIAKGYDPVNVRLVHEKLWERQGLTQFEAAWQEAKAGLVRHLLAQGGCITGPPDHGPASS